MNTNLIKLLYTIVVLIGFFSCSQTALNGSLNAYLCAVTDIYPFNRSLNDVDSATNKRFLRFHFQLKNDTEEIYWLKLRKYYGHDYEDTISFIGSSVCFNNKEIKIDSYDQNLSFIFKRNNEYDVTQNFFYPGDSASVIIDLHEYMLDSLGIAKMTPAIDITNMIGFKMHKQINSYKEHKIPHIELQNSNKLGKVYIADIEKKVRMKFDVHHDSINNVIYIHPFFWKDPLSGYWNIIHPTVRMKITPLEEEMSITDGEE